MLNKVTLIGNLGQDPESRSFSDGTPVANLSIATSERWKGKDGQKQEKTEWHKVVLIGPLAEIATRFLTKGSKVYLEGQLRTRKWQGKDGQDRYTTEVVLSGPRAVMQMLDGAQGRTAQDGGRTTHQASPYQDQLDDDIPF